MKKLVLVALCSTSLLSIARAEGGGNMGSGDAMQHPDSTQATGAAAKQTKKQGKKQGADAKMKHGAMDHGSMQHGSMDHGSMQHGSMDHGSMQHGGSAMEHGSMQQGGEMESGTK